MVEKLIDVWGTRGSGGPLHPIRTRFRDRFLTRSEVSRSAITPRWEGSPESAFNLKPDLILTTCDAREVPFQDSCSVAKGSLFNHAVGGLLELHSTSRPSAEVDRHGA